MSVGSLAPYTLLWPPSGVIVTALAATVNVAAFDVAVFVPSHVFVKTARYWLSLCETLGRQAAGVFRSAENFCSVSLNDERDPHVVIMCMLAFAVCVSHFPVT